MKLNNSDLLKFALNFADESKKILQKNYFKTFNIEEKNFLVNYKFPLIISLRGSLLPII